MIEKKNDDFRLTPAALSAMIKGDFENAIIAATPGGIEKQEKEGQNMFIADSGNATSILPKDCPKEELEKMGVEFLTDYDDIFVNVILPKGWKKKATDHSMWSKLYGENGKEIASIFYKAAFYDRGAFLRLS